MAVEDKLVNLGHLTSAVSQIKSYVENQVVNATDVASFKRVTVDGNRVKFFTTTTATVGESPAYTIDFPSEMFLDQATTTFVTNFTWSATTYPNSTNPNMNGSDVLVLGVKTRTYSNGTYSDTIAYSFINLADLIDTYTVATDTTSQRALDITNNAISFRISNTNKSLTTDPNGVLVNISSTANNALTSDVNGLYVSTADKINTVGSAENIIPKFTVAGQLASSGINYNQIITQTDIATNNEVNYAISEILNV